MSGYQKFANQVEEWVEKQLVQRGYQVVFKNKKIVGVEVDRVFQGPDGCWVVCEIKAISDWRYLDVRVSQVQKMRLLRARQWLESFAAPGVVFLYYAFVHSRMGELRVYDHEGAEMEVIVDKLSKDRNNKL